MKLQALLSVALATIATAHPAPLSTRGEYIGSAYSSWSAGSGQVWDLSVTGGCINFQGGNGEYATNAAYKTGFRCRFYKAWDCNVLIGGDGLWGNGINNRLGLSDPAISATCW